MYLRKYTDKRINKTYLTIARGYRNEEGKSRTAIVKYLGDLETLQNNMKIQLLTFKKLFKK